MFLVHLELKLFDYGESGNFIAIVNLALQIAY